MDVISRSEIVTNINLVNVVCAMSHHIKAQTLRRRWSIVNGS